MENRSQFPDDCCFDRMEIQRVQGGLDIRLRFREGAVLWRTEDAPKTTRHPVGSRENPAVIPIVNW